MDSFVIKDVQELLPKIQESSELTGEISSVTILHLSDALCKKLGIEPRSTALFAYLGKEKNVDYIGAPHYYLFFLEGEGATIFPLYYFPGTVPGLELLIDDEGNIGYGKKEKVELKVEVVWANNTRKAKVVKTEQIIEINDLPEEPLFEEIITFHRKKSFNVSQYIFGNSHLFLFVAAEQEWCLMFINNQGKNIGPVCYLSKVEPESMSEVRGMIKELSNDSGEKNTILQIEKIFCEHH